MKFIFKTTAFLLVCAGTCALNGMNRNNQHEERKEGQTKFDFKLAQKMNALHDSLEKGPCSVLRPKTPADQQLHRTVKTGRLPQPWTPEQPLVGNTKHK